MSQKLLLPRFFRDVPQRCQQCVSRLQVLGSRLSPELKGTKMSGGNNQASAQRRSSAKDPLCIGFASCSACFRTESWRQKGAASQPLAPGEFNFLGKGFFCTCHWHQDRLESERGNRRRLQTRCPSGPSTGGSNLTLRRPTIHHRRSNLPRQQLQIC